MNLVQRCSALLFLLIAMFACSSITQGRMITDMSMLPILSATDGVEFFVLQAPFPYNVPDDIQQAAGSSWNGYAIAHSGLGVWDTTTNQRFSIEFISDSYTGSLLPVLNPDTSSITWDNSASVVVTDPLEDSNWIASSLVSTTNGAAYNNLAEYLQDNRELFTTYQPVAVIMTNGSTLMNVTTVTNIDSPMEIGSSTVQAHDSYWFVTALLVQLGNFGSDLEIFLQVYQTSFYYLQMDPGLRGDGGVTNLLESSIVEIPEGSSAMAEVYAWFSALNTCYAAEFDVTSGSINGAQLFLQGLKVCYQNSSVAYVYASANSVYNITLFASTDYHDVPPSANTPLYAEYEYVLPGSSEKSSQSLVVVDYVLISIMLLLAVLVISYAMYRLYQGPVKNQKADHHGKEEIAKRLVDGDGEDNDAMMNYYKERASESSNHSSFAGIVQEGIQGSMDFLKRQMAELRPKAPPGTETTEHDTTSPFHHGEDGMTVTTVGSATPMVGRSMLYSQYTDDDASMKEDPYSLRPMTPISLESV
jgi:hypothetical protein